MYNLCIIFYVLFNFTIMIMPASAVGKLDFFSMFPSLFKLNHRRRRRRRHVVTWLRHDIYPNVIRVFQQFAEPTTNLFKFIIQTNRRHKFCPVSRSQSVPASRYVISMYAQCGLSNVCV